MLAQRIHSHKFTRSVPNSNSSNSFTNTLPHFITMPKLTIKFRPNRNKYAFTIFMDGWKVLETDYIADAEKNDYRQKGGPIPPGTYFIVPYQGENQRQGWFSLLRRTAAGEAVPYYNTAPGLYGRNCFNLHFGTMSLGCVTITSTKVWEMILEQLRLATQFNVRVLGSVQLLKCYGTLVVTYN